MAEQSLNAVVTLRNEVSPWLMILQVVPDGWDIPDYEPGQFVSLGLFGSASRCALGEPEDPAPDQEKLIKRAYSIASSPVNREFLEFYIALVPGGALTPVSSTSRSVTASIFAPSGRQVRAEPSRIAENSNLVLVATSSGLAPFVSMLSTHLRFPSQHQIAIVHGVRHSWDLGYRSILMAMQHLRPNVTYFPSSVALTKSRSSGRARPATSRTCGRAACSNGRGASLRARRIRMSSCAAART